MMFINKQITLSALLLFTSMQVMADGNTLLEQCLSTIKYLDTKGATSSYEVAFNNGMCLGLVQGVRSTMKVYEYGIFPQPKICIPKDGITNEQAARIVVTYLQNNPASLHKDEVVLTMLAFKNSYPCK